MRLLAPSAVLLFACAAVAVAGRTVEELEKEEIWASAEWRVTRLLKDFLEQGFKFLEIENPEGSGYLAKRFHKQTQLVVARTAAELADAQLKRALFEKAAATRVGDGCRLHPDCAGVAADGRTAGEITGDLTVDVLSKRADLRTALNFADRPGNPLKGLAIVNDMREQIRPGSVDDAPPLCGRTAQEILRDVENALERKRAAGPGDEEAVGDDRIETLRSRVARIRWDTAGDVSAAVVQEIIKAGARTGDARILEEVFEEELYECEAAFGAMDDDHPKRESMYDTLKSMRRMLLVAQRDHAAADAKLTALVELQSGKRS